MSTVTQLRPTDSHQLGLELPYGTLKQIDKAIGKFPSTDEHAITLTLVHITVVNGRLRFEASDSYRLVQFDTSITVDHTELDVTVPWAWLQRTMRACTHRASPVQLQIEPQEITVRNGPHTFQVRHTQGVNYPNIASIIEVPEQTNLDPVAFDPNRLRDVADLLLDADHIQLWQMLKLKPLIVKFKISALSATGVAALMPIRVLG